LIQFIEKEEDGETKHGVCFNFHPGQVQAWDSTKRVVAIVAGAQSGKTEWSNLWLMREIANRGAGDYGYISPTFALMEMKALPVFKRVFGDWFRLGEYTGSPVRKFTISEEGDKIIFNKVVQPIRTTIFFGYAENPDSLESSTYKAVVADEAGQKMFRQGSYEAIMRRLAIHEGRLLIATTPYSAFGWLKREIVDRAKLPESDIDLITFPSIMNPAFPRAQYERARATMPKWRFELFYEGKLTKPAGLIYDCFDDPPGSNIVPRFQVPADWPRFMGLDFGPVNTAATFLAAELDGAGTKTGRYVVYRSYHPRLKRTPAEHKAAMLHGESGIPLTYGGSHSEHDWRTKFSEAGLFVHEPAVRNVEAGIDSVYQMFREKKLLVFKDGCEELLDEIQTYSREWDEDAQAPTEKIDTKEHYHLLDSLRYIVAHLNRKGLKAMVHVVGEAAEKEVEREAKLDAENKEKLRQKADALRNHKDRNAAAQREYEDIVRDIGDFPGAWQDWGHGGDWRQR
jgi:hypothetical protein